MEAGFQIDMVRVYIEKADYEHSLELIDELDRREDLLEHQRIILLTCRAESLVKNGDYQAALEVLVPFLELQETQQTVDDEILCDTYNKLGNAFYRINDFERAFSAFEQGYRISVRLPKFGLIAARVTKNLGLTCNQLGFKKDATRYLEKAYKFFQHASNINELANTMFYLALATENAEYMLKARSLYEGIEFVREANIAKQYYAFHVVKNDNPDKSLSEIEDCTREFERMGDLPMCIFTLSRSAMLCTELDRQDEAEHYLELAEKYVEELGDKSDYLLSEYYKAKSILYYRRTDYNQAVRNAMKSVEICVTMGLVTDAADALQVAAESYRQLGMIEMAYNTSMEIVKMLRNPLNRGK
ncbi:hypothetical protein C7459_103279 [Tumebacillus permanentifrigoris]|uniref:Uncharacterized protein n=2 Tax=Tumebacillus permanentifrigoris TaxID=378543 RepID=A0A316DC61_9BACL|nr:hypothetical protein C7459_103279 [Tumebacillus permanentifrigoris]